MSIFTFFNNPFTASFESPFYPSFFDNVFATQTYALQRAPSRQQEIKASNSRSGAVSRTFRPRLNVYEGPDNVITATFELPGLKKEDVSIEVHNNLLTISGEVASEAQTEPEKPLGEQEQEQRGPTQSGSRTWHIRERRYGRFSRTLQLPEGVEANQIKASHEDGVLTVTFPKAAPEQERKKIAVN